MGKKRGQESGNSLSAKHDYSRFQTVLLADYMTIIGNEMCVQASESTNIVLKLNKYE